MKAFVLDRYGKQRPLRSVNMPSPEVRDDEVLVQVHAAGVNLLDSRIRNGEFKLILPYRLPLVLGHDVAGVVVKAGPRVRQFKPGDEVYARADDFRIGFFAEYIAVKEDSVALKPRALTMEEAAAIPLVGLTAWQALIEQEDLKPGQNVFNASQRKPVARDHLAHRCRSHPPGRGSGFSVRIDQRSDGLCRNGTRQGQGRRQAEIGPFHRGERLQKTWRNAAF